MQLKTCKKCDKVEPEFKAYQSVHLPAEPSSFIVFRERCLVFQPYRHHTIQNSASSEEPSKLCNTRYLLAAVLTARERDSVSKPFKTVPCKAQLLFTSPFSVTSGPTQPTENNQRILHEPVLRLSHFLFFLIKLFQLYGVSIFLLLEIPPILN